MDINNVSNAAAALVAALQGQGVDRAAVQEIAAEVCRDKIAALLPVVQKAITDGTSAAVQAAQAAGGVRRVEVAGTVERPAVDLGVQHESFETLWKLCNVREMSGNHLNIYLYGPAGTGKTTAAEAVARGIYGDAWRERYHANGAVMMPYDLLGFIDAGGVYHETEFYRAYKNGGVYLFDELDSSAAAAVLAFNQALANGRCAFPCGMVERHPDCIIIAGGNTCMRGDGAANGFQRVKHDGAFRDRFVFLEWRQDETLERKIAAAYGDIGVEWCAKVQRMRAAAATAGIRDYEITSRATLRGAAMLAAGVDMETVTNTCVRKGLNNDAWEKIGGAL